VSDRELLGALGILALANVTLHRARSPRLQYATGLLMTTSSVALARRAGHECGEIGLHATSVRAGGLWGAVGALAVAGGIGAAMAAKSPAMLDDRPLAMSAPQVRRYVLVQIPLGTVVPEEVVFRGALPALLRGPRTAAWIPGVVSSLLFGLWHVLPFRALREHNRSTGEVADRYGDGVTLAAHTAAMTAAGVALYGIRRRAGHVIAPAMTHYAANALGFLGARWAGTHWQRG
jgi:membrane protease YdiL (CAAX protease family)